MNNIFLDGLPDEDMRGWKYEEGCHCERCIQFYQAAHYIITKDNEQDTPSN